MRIGINVSVLKKGENISGIGYYTYRIIKDLIELDEKNEYFLFSNCELSVNFPLKKNVHFILLPFKSRLLWSRYILGIKTKNISWMCFGLQLIIYLLYSSGILNIL